MADGEAILPLEDISVPSGTVKSSNYCGKSLALIYLQCYFVTIATILGTGILGLPVTLSSSGLYPFLVSFVIGYIAQSLLLYFFTDLLQRAYAVQAEKGKTFGTEQESIPLQQLEEDDEDEVFNQDNTQNSGNKVDLSDDIVLAGHVIIPKSEEISHPSLHSLGDLFLPCCLKQAFYVIIFIHFIAILVSYSLAGGEAYSSILGLSDPYANILTPVFVWGLAFAIVFAQQCIQPVVSLLTFVKGSLLIATVAVTYLIGTQVNNTINNDFKYIGSPFLMGTVALGGTINVMPMLFGKIAAVESQVNGFFKSVFAGLTTCAILNIVWCWAVLEIVPQTDCLAIRMGRDIDGNHTESNTHHDSAIITTVPTVTDHQTESIMSILLSTTSKYLVSCFQNVSLFNSKQEGEIATVPLTNIIKEEYPQFNWVAMLIQIFIMISITVSFLTIGSAMVHTLSGWLDSLWTQDHFISYAAVDVKRKCYCSSGKCVCKMFLPLVMFGIIFSITMLNPKGFITMLDKVTSLVLNLEAGFFVFVMIKMSRRKKYRDLKLPLQISKFLYPFHYVVFIYFMFAVTYDIFITTYEGVMKEEFSF